MVGRVLGDRFEIVSLVGKGGMASVYQARDRVLDRAIAIKVFAVDASEDQSRLKSEVRLLSGMNHPNLVTVHDAFIAAGSDDGPSFLVMEFVGGTTLREVISAGELPGDMLAAVASGIGEALQVVHDAGIVHRDVKPANILIERDKSTVGGVRAKLADFGIAHALGSARLTATQTVIGTAGYLSPEQAAGGTITGASDIYSLGLVLLECFTGQMEYPGTAAESLAARLGRDPVVPPTIPDGWSALLKTMVDRDPAVRPSAIEVARRSAELSDELSETYPIMSAATGDLAKTRLMPVATAILADPATAVTRALKGGRILAPTGLQTAANGHPRSPLKIALIALGVVTVLAAALIFFVRELPAVAPVPSPTATSSTPTPTHSVSTPNPLPTPGKGKGKGKGHGPHKNH